MFFDLVTRNSKRSRKENTLFYSSLIISIIAFYIILSLSNQDVMFFLREMESDAVNRLLMMIPLFYGMTLIIMFFLIYFACNYQMECRRHELGLYLVLGMQRSKLFVMLLAEDLRNSVISLLIGLPVGVFLSELISLITAKLVGLGIIGHHFSFSLEALLGTAAGFLLIKLAAFVILSGKISRQEIQSLLSGSPEKSRKQRPSILYAAAFLIGITSLATAYYLAITGFAWRQPKEMLLTLVLGFLGTLLLFYGLRAVMELISRKQKGNRKLWIFNFRQLQENVIFQSNKMAISSLLILAALCLFSAGVAVTHFYGTSEQHVLDYTFDNYDAQGNELTLEDIRTTLKDHDIDSSFSKLFEMKVGHVHTTEAFEGVFLMDSVMDKLNAFPESEDKSILLNNLSYADSPYLIELSSHNELLRLAGLPALSLEENEAAIYMDTEFVTDEQIDILNDILSEHPETQLDGNTILLTEQLQTISIVTDRSITLSFALILPDEAFSYYTQNQYDIYINGVLDKETTNETSLMNAIYETNKKLDETGLVYESYLQNMGRQLFYMVAASYITIYLAVIFLIAANTLISVQFLMDQQRTQKRYKTLIRMGATYETLCHSSRKQINWHFGIPTIVAVFSSVFGVRALFTGLLPSRTQGSVLEFMAVSCAMIIVLFVVESTYMSFVKRSSSKYLLTLMVPDREE